MIYKEKLSKLLERDPSTTALHQSIPKLNVNRIGIISRDYRESGGHSDFSDCLKEVLGYCDLKKCDTVLFSLFTILKGNKQYIYKVLEALTNIKSVLVEEFDFENGVRKAGDYYVFYKERDNWKEYTFYQKFATLTHNNKTRNEIIKPFIKEVGAKRIMGDLTVLLCGETNVVKYDKEKKTIVDSYGLLKVISPDTKIILNPIHDRMTRFEMKLKRAFLSKNNKLVLSVWNKGKTDKNCVNKDGQDPPWTVYANGKELVLNRENIKSLGFPIKNLEIGILDTDQIFNKYRNSGR